MINNGFFDDMKRLTIFQKQRIINLINDGISINKISELTSRAKSTIYYYYKKIKGKKTKPLNLRPEFTEKEGEIVGIFVGDGCQVFSKLNYNYSTDISFGIKNYDYLFYVKSMYEGYFKKKFYIVRYKDRNVRIKTSSKELFEYFHYYLDYNCHIKHSTVKLKSLDAPLEFKIGFIRGLLDTDGCIFYSKKEKRTRISFMTTSEELAKQVKIILNNDFDIPANIYLIRREHKGEKDIYNINVLSKGIGKFLRIFRPFKAKKGL